MRRKYDIRNKKSFLIIVVLAITIISIFSLFIYRYKQASKIEYKVDGGSVLQDTDKNFIRIDDDATLKIRWNNNYYLIYQDKKISLGKRVIVYNELKGSLTMYGDFYEIQEDGKIIKNSNETKLSNTTNTKFYKLADREYLLVDREIKSSDDNTKALGYLLVELDKLGNAKLSNNKINLKTITPTILVTAKYRFDINNEILNFGKYDIDLKKIIGSSNQYKSEEETGGNGSGGTGGGSGSGGGSGTGTGTGTGTGNGTGGTGGGSGTGSGTGVNNTRPGGEDVEPDTVKDKTKMTSVVRVYEGLTQVDVDYVVYDPYNEYKDVYAEIIKNGKAEVIHLSKTDTHLVIDGLVPDNDYMVSFVYTTVDSDSGELVRHTFEKLDLRTKKPTYKIDKALINLSFEYTDINIETGESSRKMASINQELTIGNGGKYVIGTIDISGYNIDNDTRFKLTVVSVSNGNNTILIGSSSSF